MVIRSLVLRPLLRRPLRFLTTVAGVAAGVASVVATVSASRAAVASFREGVVEVAGRARLEVSRPGGVDESLLGRLRPLARDAVILPVVEEVALLPATGEPVRVLGLDLLVDRAARDLGPGSPAALATVERLLTGRGVLVPERLARRLGVAAGGMLTLSVRAVPTDVEVAATFTPPRLAGAFEQIVVADVAMAQELFGRQGRLDLVQLVPRGGVELETLSRRLEALVPSGYVITTPTDRSEAAGRMVRALEFNLTALSGISLLVGGVLVATTLATSVVQRRELIALVRSLGGGRGHIRRAILAEAAALGLLGGGLGVVVGLFGARAALASVRATVTAAVQDGIPPSPIQLEPSLAVADVDAGSFLHAERVRRAAAGLAGFGTDDLRVWLEDWEMIRAADGRITVQAHDLEGGVGVELELDPVRPVVRHGDGGVSTKGAEPGITPRPICRGPGSRPVAPSRSPDAPSK